ncbi:MAG: anti-sigma factor ChrR (cupin superfamily) [Candidatus Poriferisodalaceae bacterium]|jgi:anti-sigma factor ChrR (cupin superfamily)
MTLTEATTLHDLMRYVDTESVDWKPIDPGSRFRTLHSNKETGERILMVQWDAGYTLPFRDEHSYDEFIYILSGTFVDQHRSSGPGTFIQNEPGSWHQPTTPDGCTFMVVISPRHNEA